MKCDECKLFFDKEDIIGYNGKNYCLPCFQEAMGSVGKTIANIRELFKKSFDKESEDERTES